MIQGHRKDSKLLHIPFEDMLYVLKNRRNGSSEYICYQTILTAPKKNGAGDSSQNCTARVRILPNGICERMGVGHTCHHNHSTIRRNMEKAANMKGACEYLRKFFAVDAHKIPSRHIFQREISK